MAGFSTDKDRKVIPRWRTFDMTLRLRELESVTPSRAHQQVTPDFLAPKIMDWLEHQTVGHAADLVGTALSIGREKEVSEAARFLLRNDLNVSPWARELAEHALRTPEENEIVSHPEALEEKTLQKRIGGPPKRTSCGTQGSNFLGRTFSCLCHLRTRRASKTEHDCRSTTCDEQPFCSSFSKSSLDISR